MSSNALRCQKLVVCHNARGNPLLLSYLLGQDMTQGQFLSGIQSFPSPRLVDSPTLKNLVFPTIYP